MGPEITSIESTEFAYPIEDVGTDQHGFNLVYEPGSVTERKLFGIKIHTDDGITGEYVGGNSPGAAQINSFADYLVGKNPLERERHWSEMKRAMRKYDRMGIGGFKIHGWGGSEGSRDLDRELAAVHAVGERVGDEMDLMHDPACELET
ncbi:MAG: mandelate racemase, partial [Halobacteriales archaeon]